MNFTNFACRLGVLVDELVKSQQVFTQTRHACGISVETESAPVSLTLARKGIFLLFLATCSHHEQGRKKR